jgi:putative FmdB family regulatory protein
MPLYEYRCTSCGQTAEIRHGFNENQPRRCLACDALMARVFSAAPILFKGSGFYVTDSRKSAASEKSSSETKVAESKTAESKAAETKSGDAKDAPPKAPAESSTPESAKAKGTESAA